jgi:methylthioribulose-1-phosphate dehydratase
MTHSYGTSQFLLIRRALVQNSLPSASAAAAALVEIGRWVSARDWVPATSGNLSLRTDSGAIAITRSGVDKGFLTAQDILLVDLDNPTTPGTSAETPLHLAAYRCLPDVNAVLHTHSRAATLLSRRYAAKGGLTAEGFELQKGIAGVTTHEGALTLPIYDNTQDIEALAEQVEQTGGYAAPAHGLLLAGHGLYVWGKSEAEARRHLVAWEFLMDCVLEEERAR